MAVSVIRCFAQISHIVWSSERARGCTKIVVHCCCICTSIGKHWHFNLPVLFATETNLSKWSEAMNGYEISNTKFSNYRALPSALLSDHYIVNIKHRHPLHTEHNVACSCHVSVCVNIMPTLKARLELPWGITRAAIHNCATPPSDVNLVPTT